MNVRSRGKASWLLIYSKLCRRRLVALSNFNDILSATQSNFHPERISGSGRDQPVLNDNSSKFTLKNGS
ncbi:hypothetical protein YC2023_027160 [Brassica napus]